MLRGFRWSLRAKLLLGLGVILFLLLATSGLAYRNVLINREAARLVEHTSEVLQLANAAENTVEDLERQNVQFQLGGSTSALVTYQADVARYHEQFTELENLTSDNPPQVERWRAIVAQLEQIHADTARGLAQQAFGSVRASLDQAIQVERQLLGQRTDTAEAANVLLEQVLLVGALTTTIFGLLIAWLLSNNVAHAMERFAKVAQAIAAGRYDQRINLRRSDEIGRAAGAFDQMASSLQREVARLASVQHQTEMILNSTAEGIYGIDRDGRCTIVNPSAARITGYSVDELRGSIVHTLIHHSRADGSPYPRQECPASAAMRDGKPRTVRDEVFWRKDGSCFPVEFSIVPFTEDGQITGAVQSFRDITERRNVERMKDEFISVVSHELRTPLTSIRGSLGLLAGGLLGPISSRATRMVDVAVSNTDRLVRLINDILDIERIESGRAPMDRHWTDARDLVLRSVEAIRAVADDARVKIVADADPILLRADPDRVQQTLTNLLGNAIKFSPPGSQIDVRAVRQSDNALITVRDRGRGIPPEKLETIFGRFEQVDASDAREKGGSGLGLAIARSIVKQHGGRIWVESSLGEGSTFYFTMPLTAPYSTELAPPAEGQIPTILVCDDDPDIVAVVGQMLARHGYRPIGASTGEEALQRAAAERPAAVLLDLAMPGMSGWETLLALKDNPATHDIPVVILSGLERASNEPAGGHEGWIAKPVTPDSLRGMLEHVLARRSGPARILIVEDDVDLARVLLETFRQHGIETHHATSGEEAIAISRKVDPDLLLLDLALPSGTGFDVVDWFRMHDRLRRVAMVVYTARDLSEEERTRLELGPTEFLTKARIPPDEVRRRVLTLLERVVPSADARAA